MAVKHRFWSTVLAVPAVVGLIGIAPRSLAAPAAVFQPHLDRIRENLPSNFTLRLPSKIFLRYPADDEFIRSLAVRMLETEAAPGLKLGLFSCNDGTSRCLIGTFAVASAASPIAQKSYQRHVQAAYPIQLGPNVIGHLLEGSHNLPPVIFSSVMWRQDGLLYTVSFPYPERQNMLFMAVSMANADPIRPFSKPLQSGQSDRRL